MMNMKAFRVTLTAFIVCLIALPVFAADIRTTYRNNAMATLLNTADVRAQLISRPNYSGTRGFCRASAYYVVKGRRESSAFQNRVSYGRTTCPITISATHRNRFCRDARNRNSFDLSVIFRSDLGQYLGEVKVDYRRC